MKSVKVLATLTLLLTFMGLASAQTWTPLVRQPGVSVGPMIQLRDGRILVNESQGPDPGVWLILTPDSSGNYVNGTWKTTGHLQAGYQPVYFGSQLQLDGKHVVIEGGEYNQGVSAWTTLGAVGTITPFGAVTWKANSPPTGWSNIGDAESIVLPNGKYMQANCCSPQNAIYNGPNSWTMTGSVKQPNNDESGFTLLTNGKVLTVDAKADANCSTTTGSELYNPTTGTWSCGPNTPVQLYNSSDEELGAAVLMYNNKVFQSGGNVVATAIYNVSTNTWSAGPTPANGLDQADGPSALEPNGKVLAMYSPGLFNVGCQFVEYNPATNTLANTANPTNCPTDSSYYGHLMILPTGQIMFTDFSGTVEIYTPKAGVVASAVPKITSVVHTFVHGSKNNVLTIKGLNGLSQNNAYGDDYQGDTDYPLVRLKNSSGKVFYAFTHDDSTHSIAPGTTGTTKFDLPASVTPGSYTLYVVVNGIASTAFQVTIT